MRTYSQESTLHSECALGLELDYVLLAVGQVSEHVACWFVRLLVIQYRNSRLVLNYISQRALVTCNRAASRIGSTPPSGPGTSFQISVRQAGQTTVL